jgi:hypothetical protein
MNSRSEQLSRASVAAAFAVITAAVSHTVAGGQVPSVLAIALSFLLTTLASIPLVGKSASLFRISATVLLGQVLLHGLYSMFPASIPQAVQANGGIHDHSLSLITLPETLTAANSAPVLWMTIAHIFAGVLAIVVLRHADIALAVVRSMGRFVLSIFSVPVVVAPREQPALRVGAAREAFLRSSVLLSVIQRRGPPASA